MTHDRLVLVPAAFALLTAASPGQLTWRQAGAAPAARSGHFAFFDEARGRTTVYAGQVTPTNHGTDCWQLEGGEWIQIPVPALAPRGHGACCEDPTGGVGLIFSGRNDIGGLIAQTLRFDREGLRFETLSPASSPPSRWITAMALDTSRRRAVLFGGGDQSGPLSDTWEWDGTNWQQRSPAQSPPARANHAMTYDPVRGQIVLFGGHNGGSLDDTWVYDGTTWTNVSPAYRPDRLHNAMLAFDPNRNVVVLFGGKNDAGVVNDFLWEWNGSTWSGPVSPAVRPQARELATLTYDKQRQRLTLIGGQGQGGTLLGDAWAWDGSAWTQLLPGGRGTLVEPWARDDAVMAYSHQRNSVVLFGGFTRQGIRAIPLNDTWESAGRVWQRRTPAISPPAAFRSAGAMLRGTGALCFVPGVDILGNPYNSQWVWGGSNWSSVPLQATPIAPQHQVLGSLQSSQLGWVLVRLVTSGSGIILTSTLQLIVPSTGVVQTMFPSGGPGARLGSTMVQSNSPSDASNKVWLFGGATPGIGGTTYHNDLWELADTGGGNLAWTRIDPVASSPLPPARLGAAVARWPFSDRIYLAGGSAATVFGDAWYFDLRTRVWSQVSSVSARYGAAMTHDNSISVDASIGSMVLFGGYDGAAVRGDIRECGHSIWLQRTTAAAPGGRAAPSLVYDRSGRRCILFGGGALDGVRNDTWSYDGSVWSPIVGHGRTPHRRRDHVACYDEARATMVVFGGEFGNSETYALSSNGEWSSRSTGPAGRSSSAMVYVASLQRCLLFGGDTYPLGPVQGDAWTYDVSSDRWQAISGGPAARYGHAMAYDRARDRVVLFGGRDRMTAFADTWEYSTATGWQQRTPVHRPPPAVSPTMAFDESRARTVLVSSTSIWEWDGTDWLQRTAETPGPPAHMRAALAYDSDRARLMLVGGDDGEFFRTLIHGLRELNARIDVAGRGNTAQPQGLRYYSQPVLGQTLRLGFANPQGTGLIAFGMGPAQQPLVQMGGPFCEQSNLWTMSNLINVGAVAEPNVLIPVPNNTALRGTTLLFQGFPYQAAGCFRATDALHVRF